MRKRSGVFSNPADHQEGPFSNPRKPFVPQGNAANSANSANDEADEGTAHYTGNAIVEDNTGSAIDANDAGAAYQPARLRGAATRAGKWKTASTSSKVLTVVLLVGTGVGLVGMLWSAFSPRMGKPGLYGQLAMGICMLGLSVTLIVSFIVLVQRAAKRIKEAPQESKLIVKDYAIRYLNVILNIVVYGFFGLLAIFSLPRAFALFNTPTLGVRAVYVLLIVVSIAAIVLFRLWRTKRHPVRLRGLVAPASILLTLVIGAVFLPLGIWMCSNFIADQAEGPQTGTFVYQREEYTTKSGYYTETFYNESTGKYLLAGMTPKERSEYSWALTTHSKVTLTYYEHSKVIITIS